PDRRRIAQTRYARARPATPSRRQRRPRSAQLITLNETVFMMPTSPLAISPLCWRFSLDALPLHEPILVVTFIGVACGGIALLSVLTYFRLWGYLWKEWFTSVDHKKIGIMYIVLAIIMLIRGFSDALLMRAQQALAFNGSDGFPPPPHYHPIFT